MRLKKKNGLIEKKLLGKFHLKKIIQEEELTNKFIIFNRVIDEKSISISTYGEIMDI
jgi:hypothetical protein